ncbi:MAG: hypothetical protein IIW48_05075 [Clostridia bacterium]|nr:hypothetical protein [Clostridia bacterium]
MKKIMSFVGGHDVKIYSGTVYDPSIRKRRGGEIIAVIPYSGRMLSAVVKQSPDTPIQYDGVLIPVNSPQIFTAVDPVPPEDECDFCVVSAMYVAACKALGLDTSRLLTIGEPVADEEGRVIGTASLNRN